MNKYPNCYHSFMNWCNQKPKWANLYYHLGSPKPFDVTLRDGLQGLDLKKQQKYTLNKKLDLYYNNLIKYNPKSFEVGSIESPKILPIFQDTLQVLDSVTKVNKTSKQNILPSNYVLIPNQRYLMKSNILTNNYSFITSFSDEFQVQNTKMSLEESYSDIFNMMIYLSDKSTNDFKTKLYMSCFTECPLSGKLSLHNIFNIFLRFLTLPIDDICLSDTCGTLQPYEFKNFIKISKEYKVNLSKLSLHLHVNPENEQNTIDIIHTALDNKIVNFDVSSLETGGCSVTMKKEKMFPNLSYDLYYKALVQYIIKKTQN